MAAEAVKPWWREAIETIVWAFVLAMIIRTFIVQAFWIPSGSMIPTLEINDRVLVAKFWTAFFEPSRGSLYVFRYPLDPERDFVKRIIAIPGDTVDIKEGVVYINGVPTEEEYVKHHDKFTFDEKTSRMFKQAPFTVPEGKYFMLGDNRGNSQDSRYWGFADIKDMRGPVFFRYWPLNRIGIPK